MKPLLFLVLIGWSVVRLGAQPLSDPYTFSFPAEVAMDTTAFVQDVVPAGSHGRITIDADGHFRLGDGTRFRIAGVSLYLAANFPDSATGAVMARRMRALGINCVRLSGFDYTEARTVSILADGSSTLGAGLDADQMRRFDHFVYELRKNGIYFTMDFHSYWNPRRGDPVLQWDSTGWGARMPLLFDEGIQRIHRGIITMMLEHVNPYTNLAYKDDPALVYITLAENASLIVGWAYSHDIVRPNQYGSPGTGDVYVRLIDSLYQSYLMSKGLGTDAALNAAWTVQPEATTNQLQNAGFEDPFSTSWVFSVDQSNGAKAVMQSSETDKKEGTASARIRIASIDANASSYSVNLIQVLPSVRHLHRYRLSFWAKTSSEQGSRQIGAVIFNATFPNESYGLQQVVDLTSDWKRFELDFTAQVSDSSTAALVFVMGNSLGDVYLDDVNFHEIGFPGLTGGESITNGTVRRHEIFDATISPARAKSEADFYFAALSGFYDRVYRMIRDTIGSQVLLCPSSFTFSAFEYQAAKQYDVFSSLERRTDATSVLSNIYGGSVAGHANSRIAGKAFVMAMASIDYPRPYQPEMGVFYPAYAGLQDWDGIFTAVWDFQGRVGKDRTDVDAASEIYDKPHVLALLPGTNAALRNHDIKPSTRVVEITNSNEALTHPRLHVLNPYSLSLYTDPRLPIFRRVHTLLDLSDTESLLPHLEVSQISTGVDPSALDAENEQIFWDATKELFRVSTPRFVAVTGNTSGQIVTLPGVIVENSTVDERATITLASLTPSPLTESSTSLLTIVGRAQNEGPQQQGPMQLQGISARVTITAPTFDSLYVQPLGNDARPLGARFLVPRSPTGRFSIAVNTKQYATPWYRLEFGRVTSGIVAEDEIVVDNEGPYSLTIADLSGHIVMKTSGEGRAQIDIVGLANGVYIVHIQAGDSVRTEKLLKY